MAAMSPQDRMEMLDKMHERMSEEFGFMAPEEAEQKMKDAAEREYNRDDKGRFVAKQHNEYLYEKQEENANLENDHQEEDPQDENFDDQQQIDDFLSYEDLKSRKVKAKINGEEVLLDGEELLRKYQKEEAADKRFQEAAMLQKQLAKEREELLQFQQKLLEQQSETVKAALKAKEAPPLPEKDEEKELVESILLGDNPEKSAEKIREIVSKRAAAEAARLLEERFKDQYTELEKRAYEKAQEAHKQAMWDQAINDFAEKRDDIAKDEFLVSVFDRKLNKLAQEYGASPRIIKMAEKEFDEWAIEKGIKVKTQQEPAQEQSQRDVMAERNARAEKAKKLAVGPAASAKSAGDKKEPQALTGSALVDEMARSRQPWRYKDI